MIRKIFTIFILTLFFSLFFFKWSEVGFTILELKTIFMMENNLLMEGGEVNTGQSTNSPVVIDLTSDSEDPVWIDIKVVKTQGNYYLMDSTQRSGANLLAHVQSESTQVVTSKLERLHTGYGLKINFNDSNVLETKTIEGTIYKGYYCDVGFKNTALTSGNLPITKNSDGQTFVIWKKFTGGLRW